MSQRYRHRRRNSNTSTSPTAQAPLRDTPSLQPMHDQGSASSQRYPSQERLSAPKQAQATSRFRDSDMVTVLYGYGRVSPRSISWLDTYKVEGGLIRNVPYLVAKHWKNGTRPDGKVPASKVNVTIVPQDMPETEYAKAVGLTGTEMERWSSYLTMEDARDILARIPADILGQLKNDIERRITPPRF